MDIYNARRYFLIRYLPSRPMEATHNLSTEWGFLSVQSLRHTMYITILFSMALESNLCHLGALKMTVTHHKLSSLFPPTPVVLRISSSQHQTMMDDTENIQEN